MEQHESAAIVFIYDRKCRARHQETPKVEVADTVGAGDSFTGSFCAAILNGKPVAEAHKLAVKVSAFVCTQNGAMPTIPASLLG